MKPAPQQEKQAVRKFKKPVNLPDWILSSTYIRLRVWQTMHFRYVVQQIGLCFTNSWAQTVVSPAPALPHLTFQHVPSVAPTEKGLKEMGACKLRCMKGLPHSRSGFSASFSATFTAEKKTKVETNRQVSMRSLGQS